MHKHFQKDWTLIWQLAGSRGARVVERRTPEDQLVHQSPGLQRLLDTSNAVKRASCDLPIFAPDQGRSWWPVNIYWAFSKWWPLFSWQITGTPRGQHGHGSKSKSYSEHPNPITKIGPKMGGEFTYPPKWDPKTGFDNHSHLSRWFRFVAQM